MSGDTEAGQEEVEGGGGGGGGGVVAGLQKEMGCLGGGWRWGQMGSSVARGDGEFAVMEGGREERRG